MESKSIKVNIYGSEYLIKGEGDSEHVEEIAAYLDEKMHEVNPKGAIKSPLKVAILAALNIADEYFGSREGFHSKLRTVENKTEELIEFVDSEILHNLENEKE